MKKIWNHVAEISGKAAAFLAALLWPEICPFCGKASRQGICPACRKAVDRLVIREPRCMQCGRPVRSPEQEYCRDCMEVRRSFDQGVSLWLHKKPVPWSVYQFKYHNQRRFSHFYAEEMSKGLGPQIARWRPDLLVPVPLHKKRLRKRGFNQAALLAEDLSRRLGIPADKEALVRTRDTTAQKRLGRQDRRRNITGAFTVSKNFRPVRTVLLVDDIYTTGNTMDAAAKALRAAGVQKVYFFTISIGQG